MTHIMRKIVTPWSLLSGMGNWSYAVLTEWVDPRDGSVMIGSGEPVIFNTRGEAVERAHEDVRTWPYRAEACFLNDAGKYLPLSGPQP